MTTACLHFSICKVGLQYNSDIKDLELVKFHRFRVQASTSYNKLRDSQATALLTNWLHIWGSHYQVPQISNTSNRAQESAVLLQCIIARKKKNYSKPVKRDIQGIVQEGPKCKPSCLQPVESGHITNSPKLQCPVFSVGFHWPPD